MFDRFTSSSRKTVAFAREEAQRLHHEVIGTEHLLCGVLQSSAEAELALSLAGVGLTLDRVREEQTRISPAGTRPVAPGQLPFTPRAKRALEAALGAAAGMGHRRIGIEHLLLGLLEIEDGRSMKLLRAAGIPIEKLRDEARRCAGREPALVNTEGDASVAMLNILHRHDPVVAQALERLGLSEGRLTEALRAALQSRGYGYSGPAEHRPSGRPETF
jgi:ATP-dependent Clp protease ATP-binding subunit ClpC